MASLAVLFPAMMLLYLLLSSAPSFAIAQSGSDADEIPEYQSPWPINQIAYDPYSDSLIVAAQHRLLRLTQSLNLEQAVCNLGNSSVACSQLLPQMTAVDGTAELLLIESSEHIIVCGMYFGQCERRQRASFSPSAQPSLSRPLVVSNTSDARSAGILHRTDDGATVLYLMTGPRQLLTLRDQQYVLASRETTNFTLLSDTLTPCLGNQPCWPSGISYSDGVFGISESFVTVLAARSMVYFMKNENQTPRIVGLCTSEDRWRRNVDLPLACGVSSVSIQSAVLGYASETLWSAMGGRAGLRAVDGPQQSADTLFVLVAGSSGVTMCAFGVDALNEAFRASFRSCYLGSSDPNRTIHRKEGGYREICTQSADYSPMCNQSAVLVTRYLLHQSRPDVPANFSAPVPGVTDVASFVVDTVNNVTVAYIATKGGMLHKVIIDGSSPLRPYGSVTFNADGDVSNLVLNQAKNTAYVHSSKKVMRINLANCGTSTSCSQCVQRSDPHCGWCSLLRRCTAYSECPYVNQGESHWLTLGSSPQCFGMSLDQDRLSVSDLPLANPVSLYRVPSLPGREITCCYFNDSFCGEARRQVPSILGKDGRSVLLFCPVPTDADVASRLGQLESIKTVMTLRIGQLEFDSAAVKFFNCAFHTKCVTCANSSFSCAWILHSSRCVSSSSHIVDDDFITSSSVDNWKLCPRVMLLPNQDEGLFAHVGNYSDFRVELLAKKPFQTEFRCVFFRPGGQSSIESAAEYSSAPGRGGDRGTLTCRLASQPEPQSMTLRVAWSNDGHSASNTYVDSVQDINVTVYRCRDLASHCGQCLILRQVYGCGWCESGAVEQCSIQSHCSSMVISRPAVCRNPKIDDFYPKIGPTEGGTAITIVGHNLGLNAADVVEDVAIVSNVSSMPGATCRVQPLLYKPSERIVCRTTESLPLEGNIRVTIRSPSGQEQWVAVSAHPYTFVRPDAREINPKRGPMSGGTEIQIRGKHLATGSDLSVTLGELGCKGLRRGTGVDSPLVCTTPKCISRPCPYQVNVTVDRFTAIVSDPFTYVEDPVIESVSPRSVIRSGGVAITVTGQRLDIVQSPRLYFEYRQLDWTRVENNVSKARRRRRNIPPSVVQPTRQYGNCTARNSTLLICSAPSLRRMPTGSPSARLMVSYGFVMDGVASVANLSSGSGDTAFEIEVHPDPEFFSFNDGKLVVPLKTNQTATIKGNNIAQLPKSVVERELHVRLGEAYECILNHFVDTAVVCTLPTLETAQELPMTVLFGSRVNRTVGIVVYEEPVLLTLPVIGGIVAAVVGLLAVVFIIIGVLVAKARKSDRDARSLRAQMDNLEMRVAKECKEAFAELQTDMTEMNSDESGSAGLPFFDYRTYCMKVLFPNANAADHPVVRKLEIYDKPESIENGIRKFGELISEKTFLLIFIRTLEANPQFTMRDRVYVASLVSVALQGKMTYHTEILKTLLSDLIEKSVTGGSGSGGAGKGHPRLLLRRTESVAEKMLTNWFTFLLHKFLRECAGEPLFLLYRAMKQQIDKGPVDAITGEAKYSLSEDKLLRQQIDYRVLSLALLSPEAEPYTQPQIIKVLDCDCPSQALDKILDIVYRNLPHSSDSRPSRDRVDLQWIQPNGQRVVLRDEDVAPSSAPAVGDWRRRKTLAQYRLVDNSSVVLIPRLSGASSQSGSSLKHGYGMLPDNASGTHSHNSSMHGLNHSSSHSSMHRASSQNNMLADSSSRRVYHLVKPHDSGDNQAANDRDKMVSEVYLTRLLATKGTLQNFVDDLFETIFSTTHRGSALPLAIKYMFDFLDDQALSHGIQESEVIHTWKSNSLPLRFWVNVIKNPDFVFDINKSNIVDACLSVVAQIFMESCSQSDFKLGKDSPSSKLLYAKDIPKYRKWVERYYQDIKQMPGISDPDMNSILNEESRQHANDFNTSAALYELYKYVQNYSAELCEALEDDEFARRYGLLQRLEKIDQLMGVARTHL